MPSRSGLTLAGRFFRGRGRAAVVLSHGYGANQDELLPVVSALHAAGLGAFTYDMRGTGRTGGEVTFGTLEQQDLRSAVDHVAGRDDVDPGRIGAFGFSLGASVTLMAAADDRRIRAVVADSAWSDVDHWLTPRLDDAVLHPNDPFSPLSLRLVELRTPTRLGELHPHRDVRRISPRPILFLHGQADEAVPAKDSEINHAAAREPKELWVIPGARHGDSMRPGGAASSRRTTARIRSGRSHCLPDRGTSSSSSTSSTRTPS